MAKRHPHSFQPILRAAKNTGTSESHPLFANAVHHAPDIADSIRNGDATVVPEIAPCLAEKYSPPYHSERIPFIT